MPYSFDGDPLPPPFVRTVVLVLERIVMAEPTFDHERLDVYRLSIDYVALSYQIAKTLNGTHRH